MFENSDKQKLAINFAIAVSIIIAIALIGFAVKTILRNNAAKNNIVTSYIATSTAVDYEADNENYPANVMDYIKDFNQEIIASGAKLKPDLLQQFNNLPDIKKAQIGYDLVIIRAQIKESGATWEAGLNKMMLLTNEQKRQMNGPIIQLPVK